MRRISLSIAAIAMLSVALAEDPSWWDSTVIDDNGDHSIEANYAPANLGQLKNIAKEAADHLEATLPDGAGTPIDQLVESFGTNLSQAEKDANYAPINLGQLKAVSKPFYDRLIAAGYNTKQNVIDHGVSGWSEKYPWDPNTAVSDNYFPANVGQLKLVFSFDVTGLAASILVDSDDDGLPDWWEFIFGGGISGSALDDGNSNGISDVSELVASVEGVGVNVEDDTAASLRVFTLLF